VQSGHRVSPNCDDVEKKFIQLSGLKTKACPYHVVVHLDTTETYQVNTSCEDLNNIITKSWFTLSPVMAYYYKTKNPFYKPLPKFRSDCLGENAVSLEFIYPQENNTIFLPRDFDGKTNELILKVAHSKPETTVFWYLNEKFMGTTKDIHELVILPNSGTYTITVMDEFGNEAKRVVEISE
jgi:penicillin-binding protein 1C